MPSKKNRKNCRKRRRQAQKTAQASGQVSTCTAPPVAPVENGCPASTKDVKIEDAVVNKARSSGPLHAPRATPSHTPRPTHSILQGVPRTCEAPPVAPTPVVDDTVLEARSAGITQSAPSTAVEDHASVPLDALSALSDTLGAPEPVPEPPKLDPSEIVNVPTVVSEEAEFVGERESTLPPDYRFPQGTDLPPAVEDKGPSMDPSAALDILSGDFTSTPATVPAALPKQPCLDALNMLEGDFAAPALSSLGQTRAPEAPVDALQQSCTADPSPADTVQSPESDAPDSTPGRLPDYTLEGFLHSTSEKTPELYHNPSPESAPALGPELAHKPECALDLNPEAAPESAPDSLQMDPDCPQQLTPQPSPDSGPAPGPGPALTPVQCSAPGSPAELCPESAPAIELGPNLTHLANEVDPAFLPKLGPEFTSGQEPHLVPDTIPEPEPAAIRNQNKAEEAQTDNKPMQTSTGGTPTIIACDFGTTANLPTDVPADLLDEPPAISDLPAGNMVPAHS